MQDETWFFMNVWSPGQVYSRLICKFQGPVLSEVSGEGMIVLIPEDSESEVIGVWYKDTTI